MQKGYRPITGTRKPPTENLPSTVTTGIVRAGKTERLAQEIIKQIRAISEATNHSQNQKEKTRPQNDC